MKLHPEEPPAGPWRVVPIVEFVDDLLKRGPHDRTTIIAIDGRSSSGKTTLAGRIASVLRGASVVHTDDVAWHHSIFGWVELLTDGILEPVRRGSPVSFRPPAWELRNRPGSIDVPAGITALIVEGVGASRRELSDVIHASVWVQSDLDETRRRDVARIEAGEVSREVYRDWMTEETSFLAEDRPWERADVVACGTPSLPHDPRTEVVVADPY